jgi:hypothetical protein
MGIRELSEGKKGRFWFSCSLRSRNLVNLVNYSACGGNAAAFRLLLLLLASLAKSCKSCKLFRLRRELRQLKFTRFTRFRERSEQEL